jgi:Asp-tRNA(Asn)/Glu-tRNA(Gln) amidotransferase A subunit family amidase
VRYLIELSVTCAMLTLPAAPASAQQSPFRFQEATIASIHAAFAAGQLTCTQLTKLYLDRIAAYNMQGPSLHAIITVNPKAMDIAAEMDRSYGRAPRAAGRCTAFRSSSRTTSIPSTCRQPAATSA